MSDCWEELEKVATQAYAEVQAYERGRADAIDEFLDLLTNEINKAEHYIECVNGDRVGLSSNEICACIERAKEKVKEQNNE